MERVTTSDASCRQSCHQRVHHHRCAECDWQSGREDHPVNGDTRRGNQKSGQYPDFPAIGIMLESRFKLARAWMPMTPFGFTPGG